MKAHPRSVARQGSGFVALLIALSFAFPPTACTIRGDEFLCEDAVAKLQGCCARGTAQSYACTYEETCSTPIVPDVDQATARCIIGASCSELQNGNVCGHAGSYCR